MLTKTIKTLSFVAIMQLLLTGQVIASHLAETEENLEQDNNYSRYQGKWDYGIGLDFISEKTGEGFDLGWALHLGREFYQSPNWYLGGQAHAFITSDEPLYDEYDMNFDAFSLFVTARPKAAPVIQFKAGLSRASYDTLASHDSDIGYSYGIGLVTDTQLFGRYHWLDYEVQEINGKKFYSWSVSIVIIGCLFGGC